MTSTPDEPQGTPDQSGATPPPPPAPGTPPPPPAGGATPPPPAAGGYGTPPPVGGYQAPPPAGGYQPAPPPAGGYGAAGQAPLSDSDQRMWAMLAHLGGILFSFVAPLVIWLVFRERGRYVDEQGKEALNFQITLAIAMVVGWILTIVFVGFIIVIGAAIAGLIFMIMAALAANRGEPYRYPVNIRLVK